MNAWYSSRPLVSLIVLSCASAYVRTALSADLRASSKATILLAASTILVVAFVVSIFGVVISKFDYFNSLMQ